MSKLDIDLDKLYKGIQVTEFDTDSFSSFREEFETFNHGDYPFIPIHIDSFGGEAYSLFGMVDLISSSEKPVITIAMCKAMSAASVLLACGTPGYRFMGPRCSVMIHEVSDVVGGKAVEIRNHVKETDRINKMFMDLLAQYTNKDFSFYEKQLFERNHLDWYLTPEECLKYNIVDHIGYPNYHIDFSFTISNAIQVQKKKKPINNESVKANGRKKPSTTR